jgi:hypothetical protein
MNLPRLLINPKKPHYFQGNRQLKKVGVELQYTAEQVKEILRCQQDAIYFIENYCKIISLDRGMILFKLYDCQKEKVQVILNNRKVVLMEPRQQGKTITSAACILWYTLFQENKTVAILANKAPAAREVMYRYQLMYENLPIWLQQGVAEWNKGSVELENGSIIFTGATTASGIRGKSVNWLYIDETAIIPNGIAEEFFASTYPTIMSGETTKVLLSSTPLGYNHFWKYWNDAQNGSNGFVPLFIPYWRIPGRTAEWAAAQKALLGEVKFNQEILCEFLGSSYTLISGEALSRMTTKPYVYTKDKLDILIAPEENHNYVIIVDTSRGVGGDYSAFTVIDVTKMPYTVVAKFRDNKISPILFPDIIHRVAKDYHNAYILVEVNDNGQQIADTLHMDFEYENIFRVGTQGKVGQVISSGFQGKTALGLKQSKQTKRVGCSILKTLVEEQKLLIFDPDIISELTTFIEVRGSYAADEGYHDDLAMCLVMFGWLSREPFFKDLTDMNLRKELFEKQSKQIEEELTPFGFINNGIVEEVKEEIMAGDLWITGKSPQEHFMDMKEEWFKSAYTREL